MEYTMDYLQIENWKHECESHKRTKKNIKIIIKKTIPLNILELHEFADEN